MARTQSFRLRGGWPASLLRHYATLPPSYVIRHGRSLADTPGTHLRSMQAVTTGRLWDETKNIRILQDVLSPIPIYAAGDRKHHHNGSPRQIGKAILLGAVPELFPAVTLCTQHYLYRQFHLRTERTGAAGGSAVRMRSYSERYPLLCARYGERLRSTSTARANCPRFFTGSIATAKRWQRCSADPIDAPWN